MRTRPNTTREPDAIGLTCVWGMAWGIALGLWLLAPAVLDTHRLYPDGVGQWLVLLGGLCAVFAILGAVLTVAAGFAVVCAERLAAGTFRDRTWAYALSSGGLAVAGYALDSVFIHWMNFGSLSFWARDRWALIGVAAGWLAACAMLFALYRWICRRPQRPNLATLRRSLAAAGIAGALVLVWRTPSPLPPAPVSGPLARVSSATGDTPLLFIGLDGATWRILQPAIENGSAPTLRRLRDEGLHGTVAALWPPYWSGAAWSAILTGLPRDVTGVHEDLAGHGAGLPLFQVPISASLLLNPTYAARSALMQAGLIHFTPPSRGHLNGTPVWQVLHEAGVDAAVVRFRFTYPTDGQAGIVISDWVGDDQWERLGVRRQALDDTVAPAGRAKELLAPFRPQAVSAPDLFAELLPGPAHRQPADSILDPIHELRLAADIDQRTFDAGEVILRKNPAQPFLAVYIGGLDSVEHAFWQYRFPEEFPDNPPSPDDVERLGPVVERYVRYVDRSIARLLSQYAQPPNVLIVSDHGQGATTIESPWRGWHTKDGVFVLAGPSVPHSRDPLDVSYYDVVPTIVDLKRFHKPEALAGTSVLQRVLDSRQTSGHGHAAGSAD